MMTVARMTLLRGKKNKAEELVITGRKVDMTVRDFNARLTRL